MCDAFVYQPTLQEREEERRAEEKAKQARKRIIERRKLEMARKKQESKAKKVRFLANPLPCPLFLVQKTSAAEAAISKPAALQNMLTIGSVRSDGTMAGK